MIDGLVQGVVRDGREWADAPIPVRGEEIRLTLDAGKGIRWTTIIEKKCEKTGIEWYFGQISQCRGRFGQRLRDERRLLYELCQLCVRLGRHDDMLN